jgi:hypothetical protein
MTITNSRTDVVAPTNQNSTVHDETAMIYAVSLMASSLSMYETVEGVTFTNKSTQTDVDIALKANREDISDEEVIENLFGEADGHTGEELKEIMEGSITEDDTANTGIVLTCTIE